MKQEKLSVSVRAPLVRFLEAYKDRHDLKTRSLVVERALEALREKELESAYASAAAEVDEAWESTAADGLSDEEW